MTGVLTNAIAALLTAVFECPVHVDRPAGWGGEGTAFFDSGAPVPALVICPGGVEEKRLPMGRLLRTYNFLVRGICASEERLRETGEQLCGVLALIETPEGAVRGSGAHWEIKDGALLFNFCCPVMLREVQTGEPMEQMAVTFKLEF